MSEKKRVRKHFDKRMNDIAYNSKCFICDKLYYRLELHHIDGNASNGSSDNCLFVCSKCHDLIHNFRIVDNDNPTKKRFMINLFRRQLK